MAKSSLLFLSANDIKDLISMDETIGLMRDAFGQISAKEVNSPLRTSLDIPDRQASMLFMPAHSAKSDLISLKLVTVFKENKLKDLPLIHALILLVDGTNGKPLAVMDGELITAMRTGAASGLASQLLARHDAHILGIFGAGVQARTQFAAVSKVRNIHEVYIFDPDSKKADKFRTEIAGQANLSVHITQDPTDITHCDIICTATTSSEPVFAANDITSGTHINAVGAYKPDERELPTEIVSKARLIVDARDSCLTEAGDILLPISEKRITADHIYAELGELVAGQKPARENDDQITVFKSVGHAAQDLVVAGYVYKEALKRGVGGKVNL